MLFLRFINLFYKIKSNFSYLPRELQEELVDDMENFDKLCIIARYEKLKG